MAWRLRDCDRETRSFAEDEADSFESTYVRAGGKNICVEGVGPGVVKPRLIDNGKDGTRLVSAHTGVERSR